MSPHDVLTAPASDPVDRLAWLFRGSLRERHVHPLLHLMQQHRNTFGVMEHAPAPALTKAQPVTAPSATLKLDDVVKHINNLPPLPQVVSELVLLMGQATVKTSDLAEHMEHDQALVARVLRLANSPFYGAPGRVSSVMEAIQVLGFDAVGALLTVSAVQQHFPAPRCEGFNVNGFWKHALATAIMAREITRSLSHPGDLDANVTFAAGLMHDIGLLLLITHYPTATAETLSYARITDMPLEQAEEAVMHCAHTTIGQRLAQHWRFGPALSDAIAHHHMPLPAPWDVAASTTDVVHCAHALVHALDLDAYAYEQVPELDLAAWQRLKLSDEQCLALLASTESNIRQLCEELAL